MKLNEMFSEKCLWLNTPM